MKRTNAGFGMIAIIIAIIVLCGIIFLVPRSNPLNDAFKDVQPLGVNCPKSASYTSSIADVQDPDDGSRYAICLWSGSDLTTKGGVSAIGNAGWILTASTTISHGPGQEYRFEKTIGARKYILRIQDMDGPSIVYRNNGYPLVVRVSTQ